MASGKFVRGPVVPSSLLIDKDTFYDSGSDNEEEDSDVNNPTNRKQRHSIQSTGSSRTGSIDGGVVHVNAMEDITSVSVNQMGSSVIDPLSRVHVMDSLSRDSSGGMMGENGNDSEKSSRQPPQPIPSSRSPVRPINDTRGTSNSPLKTSFKETTTNQPLKMSSKEYAVSNQQLSLEYSGTYPVNALCQHVSDEHPRSLHTQYHYS